MLSKKQRNLLNKGTMLLLTILLGVTFIDVSGLDSEEIPETINLTVRVDSRLIEPLNSLEKVSAIIDLRDNTNIELFRNDSSEDFLDKNFRKREIFLSTITNMKGRLNSRTFQPGTISITGQFFIANISSDDLSILRSDQEVEAIHYNGIGHVQLSDTVGMIGASYVQTVDGLNGSGETVCIIDSGVDYRHPALGGCFGHGCKVVDGWDYVNNDADPVDDMGHGTHVAGIVASMNSTYKGVAPGANIVAVKACDSQGNCTDGNVVLALDFCWFEAGLSANVSIVTMSLESVKTPYDENCTSNSSISINVPTFYSFVFNPDLSQSGSYNLTNISIYKDGRFFEKLTNKPYNAFPSNLALSLGRDYSGAPDGINGTWYFFSIVNRSLSSAQILELNQSFNLTSSTFSVGSNISCEMTPTDGSLDGLRKNSSKVTIS